jgi:type III secretion system chaperone SycN
MDEIDYTIETFGRSMQIDNLRFNQHNVVFLAVEKMGALLIERHKDHLVVYLAVAIPAYQRDAYNKALELCHFKEGMPMDVSVGYLSPNWLILAIRISETEVTMAMLNQAVKLLFYLHGAISA